eukprot:6155258-Lingulodinium_polyedra.AAC.1
MATESRYSMSDRERSMDLLEVLVAKFRSEDLNVPFAPSTSTQVQPGVLPSGDGVVHLSIDGGNMYVEQLKAFGQRV